MRDLNRDESGMTLIELMVVMLIGTILLSATLVTFENFVRNQNENDTRNDSVELARRALDLEAKQLRNLAQRLNQPVIDTVQPDQFIFQTSDPTRTWVRYCMDTGEPSRGSVWQQTQTVAIGTPGAGVTAAMRGGCPSTSSSWTRTENVATDVVNRVGGRNAPMFTYRCAGGGTVCTSNPAAFDQIIGVNAELFIDTTPTARPEADRVVSGVYLRNQNQAPVATFSSTVITTDPRTVLFNGSNSSDYEQRSLSYFWFEGTMPNAIDCPNPGLPGATELWGGRRIGGPGVTLQHTFPAASGPSGANRTIGLVVCDPGDRPSALVQQTVSIPS